MIRHNNILCIMALGLVAALTLCGCNEAYPELMREEEEIPIKDIINHETSKVPIIPSMTDPQYEIITRGMGSMGPWSTDKVKWTKARFRTFALLSETSNSSSDPNGHANYTVAESDTTHKLLWNQPMGIVGDEDEKGLKFYKKGDENTEETKWYHSTYQKWKYKFATYFTDGAEVANTLRGNSDNTATVDIEIDGSQDVMHSFAYHTEEELDKALQNLNAEQDKPLHEERQKLLYSTMGGHRAINPRFRINHLLTEIDFRIKGAKGSSGQNGSYKDIVVTKVELESRYKAKMKVLDDKWNEDTYNQEYASTGLLTFGEEKKKLEAEIIDNHDEFVRTILNGMEYDDKYPEGTHHHHIINEDASEPMTKGLMVAPSTEYLLTIHYDMLVPSDSEKKRNIGTVSYSIKPPAGKEMFEAGHAYTVVVTVYGPQVIEGSIHLNSWIGEGEFDDNGIIIDDSAINVGGDDNSEDWDITGDK